MNYDELAALERRRDTLFRQLDIDYQRIEQAARAKAVTLEQTTAWLRMRDHYEELCKQLQAMLTDTE